MNNYILIAEAGDFIGEKKLIAQHLKGTWEGNKWRMADGSLWEIIVTGVGALNVMQALRNIRYRQCGYSRRSTTQPPLCHLPRTYPLIACHPRGLPNRCTASDSIYML